MLLSWPASLLATPGPMCRTRVTFAAWNPWVIPIEQLAERLIGKERELAGLMERFASETVYRDPAATRALQEQCDAVRAEIAAIDAAWHERAEAME